MQFKVYRLWFLWFACLLFHPLKMAAQKSAPGDGFYSRLVEGLDTLDLNTGDILLFESKTFNGRMTRLGTLSPYTHAAMVVREADGSLWLTHATDNNYGGHPMPVRDEPVGRSGVILTRIEDIFISLDEKKTGFYKRIFIRKLDESKIPRPTREEVLALYEKYKDLPFETSEWHFILTALDLRLCGKDLLSVPDSETIICSEFMAMLFQDLSFPFTMHESLHEITPRNINRMINPYYLKAVVYRFRNGMYRQTKRE